MIQIQSPRVYLGPQVSFNLSLIGARKKIQEKLSRINFNQLLVLMIEEMDSISCMSKEMKEQGNSRHQCRKKE
jgi:hypothetical protein